MHVLRQLANDAEKRANAAGAQFGLSPMSRRNLKRRQRRKVSYSPMSNETPQTSTSTDDRVSAFALAVLAGKIVAGPDVRNACKRHLQDLKHGPSRGLIWDLGKANRAIGFFEEVLCLNGGDYEGMPFLLAPWQAFVIGSSVRLDDDGRVPPLPSGLHRNR